MIDLKNMSADALLDLAHQAKRLAEDLRKAEPSYYLALAHGVQDRGYDTVANGWVNKYSGEATVVMADGKKWLCRGHAPKGDAYTIYRQGYIEMIPIEGRNAIG